MVEIPLIPVPAQRLQILLDDQECTLLLYLRGMPKDDMRLALPRIYLDLDVGAARVITGAMCLDGVSLVQRAQALFRGSVHFVDTMGLAAPQWQGLGQRWRLLYASAGEALPQRVWQ